MSVSEKRALRLLLALALMTVPATGAQTVSTSAENGPHSAIDPGTLQNGIYRNITFGIHYKVPFGWVDRTEQMREGSSDKSLLLLEAFERPPEAGGDSVNSAVVITAENVSVYPGLKSAADYFEPLTQITDSKGFHVVNPPYAFAAGSRQLVRGDFNKGEGKAAIYQSSLVVLEKGYVVSFSFLGGSQDEVDELIGGLSFNVTRKTGTKD